MVLDDEFWMIYSGLGANAERCKIPFYLRHTMSQLDLKFDLVHGKQLERAIELELEGYPADEAASLESFRLRQSQAPELFLGAFIIEPLSLSPVSLSYPFSTSPAVASASASASTLSLSSSTHPSSRLSNSSTKIELIGFICGTRSSGSTLTHSSMSHHDPDGSSVCIHSVCVSPEYQRRGIALRLLREYREKIKAHHVERQGEKDEVAQTESNGETGVGGSLSSKKTQRPKVERILLIAHEELIPLYTKAGFEFVGISSVKHGARDWYEMRMELR